MNLYYFNPNDYGSEAFVCAENKEQAIKHLLEQKGTIFGMDRDIDDMASLKQKYTIDEYKPGQVVFSEIC